MKLCLISLLMVLCFGLSVETLYTKAICQCDSLTITDKFGKVDGNCKSSYKGSPWCYLPKNSRSGCSDGKASEKLQERQWSYEACAIGIKSVSPQEDNECQCDSLTTKDKYGSIMGNCKSTYKGSHWCFLSKNSSCKDGKPSTSVRGRQWSYEACGAQPVPLMDTRRCECDSLTVIDRNGNICGDCQSKGAPWCFLPKDGYSGCTDVKASDIVPGRQYSYKACDTQPVSTVTPMSSTDVPTMDTTVPTVDLRTIGPDVTTVDPTTLIDPRSGTVDVVDVVVLYQTTAVEDCQCNGKTRYDAERNKTVGHCQTKYRGDFWCYISSDSSCEDKKETRRTIPGLKYWSYLACQLETPFQRETQELEEILLFFPGQEIP